MKITKPEKEQASRLIKLLVSGRPLPRRNLEINEKFLRTIAQNIIENSWVMTQEDIEKIEKKSKSNKKT